MTKTEQNLYLMNISSEFFYLIFFRVYATAINNKAHHPPPTGIGGSVGSPAGSVAPSSRSELAPCVVVEPGLCTDDKLRFRFKEP